MLRIYIALAIAAVWAVAYVVAAVTADYRGFEVATPVMLVAATFLFGAEIRRRNGRP
jgi:hypothetical protein